MSEKSNGARFMAAFNDIEQQLRSRYGHDQSVPFKKVVDGAPFRDVTVAQKRKLKVFVDLRNAIVHDHYYDGLPIANPVGEVVDEIVHLRNVLLSPPTVISVVGGERPYTARKEQAISEVLTTLADNSFSQVPIYDGNQYVALLTTNAIARWVAANLENDGSVLIESGTVAGALEQAESNETAQYAWRNIRVTDAINRLTGMTPPVALILTEHGKTTEAPLTIVTASDLPVLYSSIGEGLA